MQNYDNVEIYASQCVILVEFIAVQNYDNGGIYANQCVILVET